MKTKRAICVLFVLLFVFVPFLAFDTGAEQTPAAVPRIELDLSSAVLSDPEKVGYGSYEGADSLIFSGNSCSVDIGFYCEIAGEYTVRFEYYPIKHKKLDIELAMEIDGEYTIDDMSSFNLGRVYKNDGDIKTDSQGNDYNPQQIEAEMWLNGYFCSSGGNYDSPMKIKIEKGGHIFTLISLQEPFALKAVVLEPEKELMPYSEYEEKYEDSDIEFSQKIEAESAALKSDYSLLAQNDRSSTKTSPFSYTNQKLNIIGVETYSSVGQWLSFVFDVPESGYYYIDFRYSQSYNEGLPSNRRLYINGEVPFEEADNLKFEYEPDWGIFSLNAAGEKAKYYLTEGKNTIKLEVTLGDVVSVASRLDDIVYRLNEYYRQIIMITGSNPDTYRDYNLEKEIPELIESFESISQELKGITDEISVMTKGRGDSGNILKVLSYQLDGMVKNPSTIPFRMDSLSSNIGSLSSWALDIKSQALDLDYIYVSKEETELEVDENLFEGIKREFLYFIYSFIIDYNSMDTADGNTGITVWINTGRDQANILRRMTDDMFTPAKKISVSIKITTANAMQAFLSGNAPDVMLNIARGLPVNLALRGALYNLTRFTDFNEVKERFSSTATDPYRIEDGVYGLPETESFFMMFTRDDILSRFGVDKPETWDDFTDCLQILQLNGLYAGVPYTGVDSSGAVDSGIGSKNLFSAFLLQSGGSFYNTELTTTDLSSSEAIAAFEKWTDLYSKYGLPLSYNFFNRFRTGEMPLAIALYTEYNQLKAAAPEISGLWSMSPIPGTEKEDGTVDRSQGGNGTACAITSTTDKADAAWEFIKWWTGAEAQTRYGSDLESVMGVAGRHPTANIEAMNNQQWTSTELRALSEQSRYVVEVPVIAGSYYLTRGIDNAFRETVYDGRNAKEALIVWNKEITDEIARKREEFFDD